jgi:hypothetical protein
MIQWQHPSLISTKINATTFNHPTNLRSENIYRKDLVNLLLLQDLLCSFFFLLFYFSTFILKKDILCSFFFFFLISPYLLFLQDLLCSFLTTLDGYMIQVNIALPVLFSLRFLVLTQNQIPL